MVLNQILDSAVEDKLIPTNPLKSRRLKITGKASNARRPTPWIRCAIWSSISEKFKTP